MKTRNILRYTALALACLMLGSGVTMALNTNAQADTTTVVVTSPFTAAIAAVHDSVVGVNNYRQVRSSSYGNNGYGNGFGNYGFGNFGFGFGGYGYGDGYGNRGDSEVTTTEKLYATGSGVVIAEGYVLTNYHVVEDSSRVSVTISHDDGTDADEYSAELVTYDENLDVAILKAPDLKAAPVELGDSDTLQLGDWAIVIGNPLSETFAGTVTAGIVSGLNRSIASNSTTTDRYGLRTNATNTMIQIDAAINSGNSGGGMFSVDGKLMGIPTMKYSSSGSSTTASVESIGMCIPINSCKELINKVLSGEITSTDSAAAQSSSAESGIDMTGKPRMGITMSSVTSNSSLSAAVTNGYLPNGVIVHEVQENSPAAAAGIQKYDIIVDVDGTAITSASQIQKLVADCKTGDTMKVKIYRVDIENATSYKALASGQYIDVEVTLAIVDSL